MKKICLLITLCSFVFCIDFAEAHRIRVFAEKIDKSIVGEVVFSGGHPAKNIEVQIQGVDNQLMFVVETDNGGNFSFPVTQIPNEYINDLKVVVNTVDGHRNEWIVESADYRLGELAVNGKKDDAVSAKQNENGPGVKEIAGGLVCIFLLAGIMSFIKRKRRNVK